MGKSGRHCPARILYPFDYRFDAHVMTRIMLPGDFIVPVGEWKRTLWEWGQSSVTTHDLT